MATIQDIFDWLNQGAQGDIPGTGGQQPSATPASASTSQPPQAPPASDASMTYRMPQQGISNLGFDDLSSLLSQYHSIANTPPGINLTFDPPPKGQPITPDAGGASQPTPQDYTGYMAAQMQQQYDALIKNGIPPSVARQMVTQPSMGEGEKAPSDPWPYHYAGEQQEARAWAETKKAGPGGEGRAEEAWDNMAAMLSNKQQNLPTAEDRTPGDWDTSGLFRLPTGQYAPAAPAGSTSALDYYRSLGDPSSFWWNPQPNTFWGQNLLYGQQAQNSANQGWQ